MICVGDIALSPRVNLTIIDPSSVLQNHVLVGNLEGALTDNGSALDEFKVFNTPEVLPLLDGLNLRVVSLANNHILDVAPSPAETIRRLRDHGIVSVGAGDNIKEAQEPASTLVNSSEVVFLAYGWQPIKCRTAGKNSPGVNPLTPKNVMAGVRKARQKSPEAAVVLLMHWNYELELYPQPLHRELAFRAIDAGADAVIGCHSHCVQGVEVYKGAPIVYGLGNWLFPQGQFFAGKLRFPSRCALQLAFEWDPDTSEMRCHWFEYDSEVHTVKHLESDAVEDSPRIRELTPFSGMSHQEYGKWFRQNRKKRLLLPVYENPDREVLNAFRDAWVTVRGMGIDLLMALNLKGGPA